MFSPEWTTTIAMAGQQRAAVEETGRSRRVGAAQSQIATFRAGAMQAAAGYLLNVQRIPLPTKQNRTKDSVGTPPEGPTQAS